MPRRVAYPFVAISGLEEMRAALLAGVDPGPGGVLVLGDRGAAKFSARCGRWPRCRR